MQGCPKALSALRAALRVGLIGALSWAGRAEPQSCPCRKAVGTRLIPLLLLLPRYYEIKKQP